MSYKTFKLQVRFVTCLPFLQSSFDLVTGGVDHLIFWRLDSPSLHPTVGTFGTLITYLKSNVEMVGTHAQIQTLTCAGVLDNGIVLTGTRTGHLYLWDSNTVIVVRSIPALSCTINSLFVTVIGI